MEGSAENRQGEIVGVIHTRENLHLLVSAPDAPMIRACSLLELRLDCLAADLDEVEDLLQELSPGGPPRFLITCRRADEGGASAGLSDLQRVEVLCRFAPFASLADMELASLIDPQVGARFAGLATDLRSQGISVVCSVHDLTGTPASDRLLDCARTALRDLPVDIFKAATTTVALRELNELLRFAEAASESGLIWAAMGMGAPFGAYSRLILARAGSRLNYVHLGTHAVRGQWDAMTFCRLLEAG